MGSKGRSPSPAGRAPAASGGLPALVKLALGVGLLAAVAGPLGLMTKLAEIAAPTAFVLMEKGMLPDFITRIGIRSLLQARLDEEKQPTGTAQQERLQAFVEELKTKGIAENTSEANEQHYEVPAALYDLMLGNFSKYSSALYPTDSYSDQVSEAGALLDEAEDRMLWMYANRAGVPELEKTVAAGGTCRILDMGCGWGSVSLWFAEHFPDCTVRGVSNSNSQREWITAKAEARGLTNLKIYTGNIVEWDMLKDTEEAQVDRVISIEMLEHMKNYEILFDKVATWLKPDGKMFVHIFTHKTYAYHYTVSGPTDWMTRFFFAGGTMPSADLFFYFQKSLRIVNHWHVNGNHYGLTSEAWLQNLDQHREAALPILADIYKKCEDGGTPEEIGLRWFGRWRAFFLACAECFAWQGGDEWFVSHYLFENNLK